MPSGSAHCTRALAVRSRHPSYKSQDERMIPEMIETFPFMLRFSKHSESFFNSLLNLEL
jgi:hypothetical protein